MPGIEFEPSRPSDRARFDEQMRWDSAHAVALPNGIVVGYTYDSDSHVTGMTWTLGGSQINDLAYSYDADGHVVEESGNTTATAMVIRVFMWGPTPSTRITR